MLALNGVTDGNKRDQRREDKQEQRVRHNEVQPVLDAAQRDHEKERKRGERLTQQPYSITLLELSLKIRAFSTEAISRRRRHHHCPLSATAVKRVVAGRCNGVCRLLPARRSITSSREAATTAVAEAEGTHHTATYLLELRDKFFPDFLHLCRVLFTALCLLKGCQRSGVVRLSRCKTTTATTKKK